MSPVALTFHRSFLVALTLVVPTMLAPALGQPINEDVELFANDAAAEDEFGHAVALSEGILVVGAPGDDDNGPDSGAAYLFDVTTGVQLAKLTPDDGAAGDEFGFSVAIANGIVAVGAVRDEHAGVSSGSAYLFEVSTGAQLAKLTPDDGAAGDEFGHSVDLDGLFVVVGAKRDDDNGADSGAAYLFDPVTGLQTDKLVPSDGAANDNFGGAVAIDDGIVAVGAHGDWDNGPLSGSAYLFDAATGAQQFKLLANDGATSDFFGSAIDIDNGIVAVGAWSKSIFLDHSGAAYTFDATTGAQITRLVPSDGHDRDHFGISIAIDDGVVAIGAHQDGDSGFDAGSAYTFEAFSDTQIDKLLASDGAPFDLFGSAVAIEGGVVAVGAIGDSASGNDSGSVYLYGTPIAGFVRGDANADGAFDISDPIATLSFLFAGSTVSCDSALDANDDGAIDISDPIYALSYQFAAGPAPLPPFPDCGIDPTADALGCATFAACP